MPELSEITYSHDTTVHAFRDYFRFLVEIISSDFQRCFGKTDEVIALLRDIPYIREVGPYHPAHGSALCHWADWQFEAGSACRQVAGKEELSVGEALRVMSGGVVTEDVPPHVVGLTLGDRENKHFLLDTQLGIVHWPVEDGGGKHMYNFNQDPKFIKPVEDDPEDYAPENEHEWRTDPPAWAIGDFFELLKSQYRKLNWIPVNPREVITITAHYEEDLAGMVPMLQEIYRQHGWPLEQGGCLEAVKIALNERYPSFEGWD
ncbi:hypothetical protein BKA61DRAFT_686231 [Leptodontidium sp. MPI-SDFR-AT-0119]|nr:hypothetical protein BKA61DRAFT_686231 [Leptodontidium sp. MPI-SDFR-AT-0119]